MGYSYYFVFLYAFLASVVHVCTGYTCAYYRGGYRWELTCASGECCGPVDDRYCCAYYNPGAIAGGVIGFIVFVCCISAITCFFCSCCPVYQRRNRGIIIASGPNYAATAPVVTTTQGPYPAATTADKGAPPPYQQM